MLPSLLALTATHARHLLNRLSAFGAAWITTLAQRTAQPCPSACPADPARNLPRADPARSLPRADPARSLPRADPARSLQSVLRAMRWASTLAAFLAGQFQLPPLRARPIQRADTDPKEIDRYNERESDDAENFRAGPDRAMAHAFRTRPVGRIVARICRDLGLTPASDLWPADLVAITQTPVEWVATNFTPPILATRLAPHAPLSSPPPQPPADTDHPTPPIRPPAGPEPE